MSDDRKPTLLGPARRSLLGPARTDLSGLAAAAANAMHAKDDVSWRKFCDQALVDLKANVDNATLLKLAQSAEKLRGNSKQEARVAFAQQVIGLAAQGNADFAKLAPSVEVAGQDAFVELERRKREVFERIDDHERECAKTEAEMQRLVKLTPKPTAQLSLLRTKLDALKAQTDGFRRDLAGLETLAARVADDSVRDIAIRVGYMAYPAASGPVPVYAVIECEFANATDFNVPAMSHLELSVDADRRYKIYQPGQEDAPFAETDDPVDEENHAEFQRLAKHWGYWFLRLQGSLNEWDFQIIGTKVYPLQFPIEESLEVLQEPRKAGIDKLFAGTRHRQRPFDVIAEGEKTIDRFEMLVGKLPVKRRGLQQTPGIVTARVIHKNLTDMNANAQWVRIDEDKLESQLKKIMGGPFMSIVWEKVRSGIDFMQLMPKSGGNRGPDIWLRAKPDRRKPIGHMNTVKALGKDLPLWEFQPENAESLREEDIDCVRRFYQVSDARLRAGNAVRIEASPDDTMSEVDKSTHEGIVQNYLRLCQVVRIAAMGNDENAKKVWPHLRDAVIFELPAAAYSTLYEEFFRYCVRSAKVDPDIPLPLHTSKQRKRVMDVIGTGMDAPFPEKMPFKSCFFAYGRGVTDPNAELLEDELRKRESNAPTNVGKLYGHLVTANGMAVGFRDLTEPGRDGIAFTFDRDPLSSKGQQWDRPHSLSPWIINALVSYVNEHKKLIEAGKNGLGHQMLIKKIAKGLSMKPPVPPPFYVVYLKDEFVREQARQRASSIKRHIDWQHRWKVRGHDCLKYMRGPLPLDGELEKELLARKYKIYTVEQPDSETFMALAKRGVAPKGTDEWMAVLQYWRDSFEKGPSDKPMIESVRRSTKTWGEN